jgi:hypothetical protein
VGKDVGRMWARGQETGRKSVPFSYKSDLIRSVP